LSPSRAALCRFACLVLAPAALAACAAETLKPNVPRQATGLDIAPYAAHEECVSMVPGDRLEYRFEARAPLAFNIHYHEGKSIVMPIARDETSAEAGIYAPALAQHYCLMWEAGRAGAVIDYRVRLVPGKPP
jgi:hypothetical protein